MKGLIRKIVLDGFKSLSHLEFDLTEGDVGRDGGVALIYGENGAGKTHLIESMAVLKMTTDTLLLEDVPRDISGDSVWFGTHVLGHGAMDRRLNLPHGCYRTWDLRSISEECRSIGGDGRIGMALHFTLDGANGEYRMSIGPDGRVSEEVLTYRISKNTGEIFSIRSDGDAPVFSFSRQLFTDSGMRNDMERRIRKEWGLHTFISMMKHELYGSNPGYISESVGTGIMDFIAFLDGMHVVTRPSVNSVSGGFDDPMAHPAAGSVRVGSEGDLDLLEARLFAYFHDLCTDVMDVRYDRHTVGGRIVYQLMVTRRINGVAVQVPFVRESTGMLRLLELFSAIMAYEGDGVVLMDEFDTGIHERMVRDIIGSISEDEAGQFIATTQCTGLLEGSKPENTFILILDAMANKSIRSLPRIERTVNGNNNRIRYLNGVFRGIPFTSLIDMSGIYMMDKEGDKP